VTATPVAGVGGTPVSLVLRMNLEPGELYRVRFRTEQLVTQSMQGQSFDTNQQIGYEYNSSVRSADAAGEGAGGGGLGGDVRPDAAVDRLPGCAAEQQGTVQVDLASGMTNSRIQQTLSGEMVMAAEGQSLNVPISIRSTVEVESSRIEP